MWLTRAKHGCSEEVQQHPLYPLRTFLIPLSRCKHSFWGSSIHPIPTWLAMPTQATPLPLQWGGSASRRGRAGVESISSFPRDSVAKLRRGALPLWPSLAVGPFVHPSSLSRRGYPDGGRIGLSPNPPTIKICQSSQGWAGMWVEPGSTGVGQKMQWSLDQVG